MEGLGGLREWHGWDGLGCGCSGGHGAGRARGGGFSRSARAPACIFAAPLVPLMKQAGRCVTPHAIDADASHRVTYFPVPMHPGDRNSAWKAARPLSLQDIQKNLQKNNQSSNITSTSNKIIEYQQVEYYQSMTSCDEIFRQTIILY
ncbi:hypothetical protein [Pseudorhodoferax sp.]|uniref:hypothetical protein n=1 Tax=Pseudorhodoferax sp. TaxID=1993553 RepID=UPI002DD6A076|nr:hypothetical protein [Pseudorhodoferax sp.]